MLNIDKSYEAWIDEVYSGIISKESAVIKRSGTKIPYTTENGVFDDKFGNDPHWWTNSFYVGMVWLMYMATKDGYYSELANKLEDRLDGALYDTAGLYHDVGFMWLLSSVANYKQTGSGKSRNRALAAANSLAARFNPDGGFITAWNREDGKAWAIIDCMMNIPILYWASREMDHPRFKQVANAHATKTLNHSIRPDGSSHHIVEYDLDNGSFVKAHGGQGYGEGSSWTRGQSWCIYGFALAYRHTGDARYLDGAKRNAHYFISAVAAHGYIPPIDFRAPAEPIYEDSTAGAIAACGLIEIAEHVGDYERHIYLDAALKILRALYEKYGDLTDNSDAILHGGSEGYHFTNINIDIIYGDYFFMEAIFRLKGIETEMWG